MWQSFYERHRDKPGFALMGVAIDALPDGPRQFAEKSGCSFPMALDSRNLLNTILGVKTVTNAILLDEDGVLRWQHLHGFRVARPEMLEMAERVVEGDLEEVISTSGIRQESFEIESIRAELTSFPDNPDYLMLLAEALSQEGKTEEAMSTYRHVVEIEPQNSAAHYALGSLYAAESRKDEAVASWRAALEVDPMNFTLRKQIWMLEYPERFYPEIDMAFQVEQIKKEGFPDLSKLPISIRRELEFGEGDA